MTSVSSAYARVSASPPPFSASCAPGKHQHKQSSGALSALPWLHVMGALHDPHSAHC